MRFLDSAKIFVSSGNGGAGAVSFLRAKYVEFGGPNGGKGGKGADVYLVADASLNTLIDFRYRQHFKAPHGEGGKGKDRTGESGKDLIIKVPVGTVILNDDKSEILFDLTEDGQKVLLLKGGIGGLGNASFKSSTNRAPRFAQSGIPGEEMYIWLELELLADIGLIGLPNAGKSTLINSITNAKSKTANYAFTTLFPSLGVACIHDKQIVIADLPGLVEGANKGVGLGTRFLSHIKRCKAFIHVIDINADICTNYKIVVKELNEYNENITHKRKIIILNKTDLISPKELNKKVKELKKISQDPIYTTSALQKIGLEEILEEIYNLYTDTNPMKREPPTWSPI